MEILHLLRLPGVPHVEKEEQEQGLETTMGGAELVELARTSDAEGKEADGGGAA